MSTSPNLPAGAFITTLGGRRCTALPRTDINSQTTLSSTSTPPAAAAAAPVTTSSAVPQVETTAPVAVVPAVEPTTSAVVAPTIAVTTSAAQVAPNPAQSEILGTDTAKPFTTIGLASTTVQPSSQSTGSLGAASGSDALAENSSNRSNGNGSTIAVAGGVIGSVALISLIAFFIWFWRRRLAKRRRDTLLTPLSPEPTFGRAIRDEKRPYHIHRNSIGPTPRSTKVKAALRAQYGRVRGRFDTLARTGSVSSNGSQSTARSVDMNRGNSQFMDTAPILGHERKNSSALSAPGDNSDLSIKERIVEMWARFTGSGKEDLTVNDRNDIFAARGITGSMREKAKPSARPLTNKPDFLTLLNMDDSELDREAQRRRMSRARGGSEGSGVGGLRLDFGSDPFSDVHALSSSQPRNGPPVASGPNNPFTDANAIDLKQPPPSTYLYGVRRSRGQSMGSSTIDLNRAYDLRGLHVVNEESRPPSSVRAAESTFLRESQVSVESFESFAAKRDKFRSDPFDLEQLSSQVSGSIPGYTARPGFNSSSNFSTDAMRFSSSGSISMQYQQSVGSLGSGVLQPPPAHTSAASIASSKYTSGLSEGTLDEWSEPGPDVGPAMRWDASKRSSAADAYNPYSSGNSSGSNSRRSSKSSVKMGYAL